MDTINEVERPAVRPHLVVWGLALAGLLAHLLTNHRFGFHHDELYFIACGMHFDFGYVDHPPLVPWLARLSIELFGDSLRGLRLWSAMAHAATILLTARIARECGAGRFGQGIAALAALVAPAYLRAGNILAIPSFEPFYWALGTFLLIRLLQGADPRWWLAVGAVAGVGLLNKHTMLFWGAALLVGLVLTEHRRVLKSPWIYAGGAIALLIFLPNLLWQVRQDWATVQFLRQLNEHVMGRISPLEFSAGQVLYMNPLSAPLWIGGLVFGFTRTGKPYRLFAWMYLFLFLLLLVVKSKIYYLMPMYPVVFALGGVAWEQWLDERTRFRTGLAGAMAASGLLFAPLALPVLSIDRTDRYIQQVTLGAVQNAFELTGDLHAQFGWEKVVREVGEVFQALPEEDQQRVTLFASHYGLAGALDLWGDQYGLPPARSPVLSYHGWGVGDRCCDPVLVVTTRSTLPSELFEEITELREIEIPEQNPHAQRVHVLLCRAPLEDLKKQWPQMFSF